MIVKHQLLKELFYKKFLGVYVIIFYGTFDLTNGSLFLN